MIMEVFIPLGGVFLLAIGLLVWSKYEDWLEKKGNKDSVK